MRQMEVKMADKELMLLAKIRQLREAQDKQADVVVAAAENVTLVLIVIKLFLLF